MKLKRRNPWAVLSGVVLAAFFMPQAVLAEEAKAPEPVPVDELRTFAEIFGRIKQEYVEPVGDTELLEHAIRGMLSGLDRQSRFLTERELLLRNQTPEGQNIGFGFDWRPPS